MILNIDFFKFLTVFLGLSCNKKYDVFKLALAGSAEINCVVDLNSVTLNKNDGINLGSEYKLKFEGDLLESFLINIGKKF